MAGEHTEAAILLKNPPVQLSIQSTPVQSDPKCLLHAFFVLHTLPAEAMMSLYFPLYATVAHVGRF